MLSFVYSDTEENNMADLLKKWLFALSVILLFVAMPLFAGDNPNETDFGRPYKLNRLFTDDTFHVQFGVFGDPQPDVCHCWNHDSDRIKMMREIADSINDRMDGIKGSFVVGVGDLTQHTCCQEVIAFRQIFEHDYPGYDRGTISSCAGGEDDEDYYSDGHMIDYPVFPGLGNHDDPSEVHESCDRDASCSERSDKVCHSDMVKAYILQRVKDSDALYRHPFKDVVSFYDDNYAWEVGSYHFIMGNLWFGYAGYNDGNRHGTDWDKLNWLKDHLKEAIGDSGKPVILFQHFNWDEFGEWWSRDNADRLINILCRRNSSDEPCDPYNILGIFTGHSHYFAHNTVDAGNDAQGNPVTFDDYIVNDAGPNSNGNTSGFYIVTLDGETMKIDARNDWGGIVPEHSYEKDIDTVFLSWEQGEPNNAGGIEQCGEFMNNGRFRDNDCAKERYFACKSKTGDTWKITDEQMPWREGCRACSDLGDYIYDVPNSLEDQKALMDEIESAHPGSYAWINYTDKLNNYWTKNDKALSVFRPRPQRRRGFTARST